MFTKTAQEIGFYPTDLFLTEHTHNSFNDLKILDWEFKEEMRQFIEQRLKLEQKKIKEGK